MIDPIGRRRLTLIVSLFSFLTGLSLQTNVCHVLDVSSDVYIPASSWSFSVEDFGQSSFSNRTSGTVSFIPIQC